MPKYQRTQIAEVVKVEELLGMPESEWPEWVKDARGDEFGYPEKRDGMFIWWDGDYRKKRNGGYLLLTESRVVWRSEAEFAAEGWKEVVES